MSLKSPMIIVELIGGLGNQMFQYALGRRLSHDMGFALKLDVSGFENYALRTYRLGHFNIQEDFATPDERQQFRGRRIHQRARRLLERALPIHWRTIVRERRLYRFDPAILRISSSAYLIGYWQTERYFKAIEHIIRQAFTNKTESDRANQEMAEHIQRVESVSIHIRRGDYVTNPTTHAWHGIVPLDYYHVAADRIAGQVGSPHLFVFSDDPQWACDNLHLGYPMSVVAHNGPEQDYEDLRLMSLCQHHIIANSSFSWWGAWLCANPHKIVYAPARWVTDPRIDTREATPAEWQRLEVIQKEAV